MAMDPTDAAAANALANMKNAVHTGHHSEDVNALMNMRKSSEDRRAAQKLLEMKNTGYETDGTEDEAGFPVRRRGGKNRKSRKGRKSKKSRKSRKSTRRSSGRR